MNARYVAGSPRFAEGAQVARGPRSRLVRRAALAVVGLSTLALAAPAAATTETFNFTGAAQTWTVPAGVTEATFDLYGAQGGGHPGEQPLFRAGLGGRATATIAVTSGDSIQVNVGGRGDLSPASEALTAVAPAHPAQWAPPAPPAAAAAGPPTSASTAAHSTTACSSPAVAAGEGLPAAAHRSAGRPEVAAAESSVGPGRPVVVQEQPAVAEERRPKGAAPRPQRRKATAASVETPLAMPAGAAGAAGSAAAAAWTGQAAAAAPATDPRAPSLRPGFAAATATSPSPTGSPPPPLPRAPRPTSPSAARSPTPRPSPTEFADRPDHLPPLRPRRRQLLGGPGLHRHQDGLRQRLLPICRVRPGPARPLPLGRELLRRHRQRRNRRRM